MKSTLILHIILFVAYPRVCLGQNTNIDSNEIYTSTKGHFKFSILDSTFYPNKNIKHVGNLVLNKDSTATRFKIGFWKEYYPNGQLKHQGNYKIDTYKECCTIGWCYQFMNYKYGEWIYYYNNGLIKAKGIYLVKKTRINTNCEGGDKVYLSFINKSWVYYNTKGEKCKLTMRRKKEIQLDSQ